MLRTTVTKYIYMEYMWLYMHVFDKFVYLFARFASCWIKMIQPHKLLCDGCKLFYYFLMYKYKLLYRFIKKDKATFSGGFILIELHATKDF